MTLPNLSEDASVLNIVRRALAEDLDEAGDVTTLALVPDPASAEARIIAREKCVVAGTGVATVVFCEVDPSVRCTVTASDGSTVVAGGDVMRLAGPARGILTAERTALNFLQRMSGIATLTSRFVEKARPYGVEILDTRKTTPTLRKLEKYAVRCGGGRNHRMGLADRFLVKDNHRRLWQDGSSGNVPGDVPLDAAVRACRESFPGVLVEVEVETEEELRSVLEEAPDWVLLDNLSVDEMERFVRIAAGKTRVEASGGITLQNVEDVARTGVDAVSVGCLTHSAPAIDLSLELV